MPDQTSALRVLVLARQDSKSVRLPGLTGPEVHVRQVESFDDALAALRDETFDAIVSEQSDFIALERASMNHQAGMILETLGQGVCIVSPDGRLIWANARLKQYPEDVARQVCEVCVRTIRETAERSRSDSNGPAARRFTLSGGNDQHFEVTVTPVLNTRQEAVQAAAVVWDVTQSFRLQKKIDAIDRAGRELVRLNAESVGMGVQERIRLLQQRMESYMRELLRFDDFAVLLIDKKTNKLDFILEHGMGDRSHRHALYVETDNNGISGYVAATGRSYICHDTSKDPRYLEGVEKARSSLTVPLRLNDEIIGVLDIESERLAAFNEDDRQFAEILARYLAIALKTLDLIIIERFDTMGRFADDVMAEIGGPLNDIVTEAQTLTEEYIGNDELRRRLGAISDHVAEVKKRVRDLARPRGGIIGRLGEASTQDPLLAGRHVLVADDEATIRETIGGLLSKLGCKVKTAIDGADAIAQIEASGFDIVLADIRMPHHSGYEVFAAARQKRPDMCVVLMTGFGYDPNHSVVRARSEGLNAVLFKPFKVDQLLDELRKALSAPVAD